MEIAIISDTHIPSRATRIPPAFREKIEAADHVIHAGDFDSKGALADIRDLSSELTAVAGNTDPPVGLPAVATLDCAGSRFVVTHGDGSRGTYEQRVVETAREHGGPDAVGIAGHTHEPLDTEHDGTRLLNPGSVTGAAPAKRPTMLTATVEAGELAITLHELP